MLGNDKTEIMLIETWRVSLPELANVLKDTKKMIPVVKHSDYEKLCKELEEWKEKWHFQKRCLDIEREKVTNLEKDLKNWKETLKGADNLAQSKFSINLNLQKENKIMIEENEELKKENDTLKRLNKTHRTQIDDLQFKISDLKDNFKKIKHKLLWKIGQSAYDDFEKKELRGR